MHCWSSEAACGASCPGNASCLRALCCASQQATDCGYREADELADEHLQENGPYKPLEFNEKYAKRFGVQYLVSVFTSPNLLGGMSDMSLTVDEATCICYAVKSVIATLITVTLGSASYISDACTWALSCGLKIKSSTDCVVN